MIEARPDPWRDPQGRPITPMSAERQARYAAGEYTPPLSFDRLFSLDERALILRGWAPEGAGVGFPDLARDRVIADIVLGGAS